MPFSLTQQQKTTLSKYIDDQSIVDVFGALTWDRAIALLDQWNSLSRLIPDEQRRPWQFIYTEDAFLDKTNQCIIEESQYVGDDFLEDGLEKICIIRFQDLF